MNKCLWNLTEEEEKEIMDRKVNHYQHMRFIRWIIEHKEIWRKIYGFNGERMTDDECKQISEMLVQNHFSDMNLLLLSQYPWVFDMPPEEDENPYTA